MIMRSLIDKIMTEKANVLLLLAAAALMFVFYLILSSEIVTVEKAERNDGVTVAQDRAEGNGKIDLNLVRKNHREEMKKIFRDYEELVSEIGVNGGAYANAAATAGESERAEWFKKVGELKSRISGLKAPAAEDKDLHLHLILSVSRMETFLREGNQRERETGIKLLAQAQKDFESLPDSQY
jgi:hypothetical protein